MVVVVGEVMSIGGNFKESVQKALGSLEIGLDGFDARSALILVLIEVIFDFQLMLTYLSNDKTDWGC